METQRRQFQGVLNILSFNRHFYFAGLGVLALLIFCSVILSWPSIIFWVILLAILYGLIMPLIVSAYVYDFSGYYQLHWLNKLSAENPNPTLIVNINAGFDETSYILNKRFPNAEIKVFDFYNAERHTEPAIIRARKVSPGFPDTKQIESDSIPLNNHIADYVFLLSAVHEIRSPAEKVSFLKECRRICNQNGKVIMVEHLRDFPNFLAFTVGFTHFFSRADGKQHMRKRAFQLSEKLNLLPLCLSSLVARNIF